ncbi:MFS transporter [uncultured Algimonas sp.]|uniref:MFS transporter n=1 Tax=uncultured Algimonas sp. TaxID=1547920 RepID=UPI00260C53BB|nr:MFS transporter [uncultured Algimonas sp.]
MSAKAAGHLLRQRRFAPLFVLFQTGTFNDNTLKNALIALITFGGVAFLSDLPSQIRVPVAALIFTGPFTILCAISGQIADKVDRGVIFRWVKRAEILIMALAGLGFLLEDVRILALCLGLMGAQSAFFSPTKNAVLPQWLTKDELITGNALMSGVQFAVLLIGTIVGTAVIQTGTGTIAIVLFVMALFGWLAAEQCPPAPAPMPDLNVNYEPVSATWTILKTAFSNPDVLRPLLGVSWFYGLSTVFVTTFPDYVASVMGFENLVLMLILAISTLAILVGSLLTMLIGDWKVWGPEAVRLSAVGIIGVALFTLGLYALPSPTYAGTEAIGPLSDFLSDPLTPLFLACLVGASLCNGVFLVPLQAMAQRRSDPAIRARLMSAGSVLLNLFVNLTTFGLIGLAAMNVGPKTPFLIIIVGSAFVAGYAMYRSVRLVERPHPGVAAE